MSLILAESFDSDQPGIKTPQSGTLSVGNGRNGKGLGGSWSWTYTFKTEDLDDRVIVGFAFKVGSGYGGLGFRVQFRPDTTGGASAHAMVEQTANGKLDIYSVGTLRHTTANGVVALNSWQYMEIAVLVHDTAGTVEVRRNGVTIVSLSGLDTKSGAVANVVELQHGTAGSSPGTACDDVYILNEQGSSFNTFLGDIRVAAIEPSGNGNSSQFTGSDGNSADNYLLMNDNNDANYVEHATENNKDTYAFGDLPTTALPILGVQVWARALTDAGPKGVALVARSGPSESDSADQALTTLVANYKHTFATKPGGGAWTAGDVAAAEFGIKVRP